MIMITKSPKQSIMKIYTITSSSKLCTFAGFTVQNSILYSWFTVIIIRINTQTLGAQQDYLSLKQKSSIVRTFEMCLFPVCLYIIYFCLGPFSCIHSHFHQYFVNPYYVPGSILGAGDTMLNRRAMSRHQESYILVGKQILRNINMKYYAR